MIAGMARVIASAHVTRQHLPFETLRAAVVCGCALALIAAGQALPL